MHAYRKHQTNRNFFILGLAGIYTQLGQPYNGSIGTKKLLSFYR